jgi:hypothetical protein
MSADVTLKIYNFSESAVVINAFINSQMNALKITGDMMSNDDVIGRFLNVCCVRESCAFAIVVCVYTGTATHHHIDATCADVNSRRVL